jgi:hypothetical protein
MGINYTRRLREQGRVVAGHCTSLGSRAWWLWQEMTLKQRVQFCAENGICEPKPPEWKVLDGVGPDCARQFGALWHSLTAKQKRAFLARAGLNYDPDQETRREPRGEPVA